MTDDSLNDTAAEDAKSAEDVPTREERADILVAEMAHAKKHNAPVTGAMLKELCELLGTLEP